VRVVVFASGGGSNFQSLIDHFADGRAGVEVAGLVASRPGIGAIRRAEGAGIPVIFPGMRSTAEELDAGALLARLRAIDTDLIVLAGYLRLVPVLVVREWWGRMINLHPALLPAFGGEGMYGSRVHEAVVEAGARVTGVTVHFVDEAYDRGPIIAQWPAPVGGADSPADVAARVLRIEHRLLPRIVEAIARGEVVLERGTARVRWSRPLFGGDEFATDGSPLAG